MKKRIFTARGAPKRANQTETRRICRTTAKWTYHVHTNMLEMCSNCNQEIRLASTSFHVPYIWQGACLENKYNMFGAKGASAHQKHCVRFFCLQAFDCIIYIGNRVAQETLYRFCFILFHPASWLLLGHCSKHFIYLSHNFYGL